MREPRTIESSGTPLFDRLSAKAAGGMGRMAPSRVLDRAALRESVRDEVAHILNTRSSPSEAIQEMGAGTVLDYGLPDFSWMTPASETDRRRIGDLIAHRVAAHESRLSHVRVTMAPSAVNAGAVVGVLRASLRIGSLYEPVSFPLTVDRQGGRVGTGLAVTVA